MADETIELQCPRCGELHSYLLQVMRDPYLFGKPGNVKRFTRLFTCPKDNENFQAVLEMKDDDRGTITKVDVVGIVARVTGHRKKPGK